MSCGCNNSGCNNSPFNNDCDNLKNDFFQGILVNDCDENENFGPFCGSATVSCCNNDIDEDSCREKARKSRQILKDGERYLKEAENIKIRAEKADAEAKRIQDIADEGFKKAREGFADANRLDNDAKKAYCRGLQMQNKALQCYRNNGAEFSSLLCPCDNCGECNRLKNEAIRDYREYNDLNKKATKLYERATCIQNKALEAQSRANDLYRKSNELWNEFNRVNNECNKYLKQAACCGIEAMNCYSKNN